MSTLVECPSHQDAKVQTDASCHGQKLGVSNCLNRERSTSTPGQRPFQQDAKTRSQSIHAQGRQSCLACWQHKSPGHRCLSGLFRIPHWEVYAGEFADELLICIGNLSLLSSRGHIRRGHAKTNNKWSHTSSEHKPQTCRQDHW